MLVKTEAIILKSLKYRDTSKIITFYTKEFGKLKGIAKGARSAKNKFGSALEPMSHSMLVIYKKEHQDLHLISQCDAISPFNHLTEDLDRMSAALAVIELVNNVTHNEETNLRLFELIFESLNILNSSKDKYDLIVQAFRIRLVSLFGFKPDLDRCNKCNKSINIEGKESQFVSQISKGAIFCNQCLIPNEDINSNFNQFSLYESISAPGLQILRRLLNSPLENLNVLEYNSNIGNELNNLTRLYLQYHFDGLKFLNSKNLFYQ